MLFVYCHICHIRYLNRHIGGFFVIIDNKNVLKQSFSQFKIGGILLRQPNLKRQVLMKTMTPTFEAKDGFLVSKSILDVSKLLENGYIIQVQRATGTAIALHQKNEQIEGNWYACNKSMIKAIRGI